MTEPQQIIMSGEDALIAPRQDVVRVVSIRRAADGPRGMKGDPGAPGKQVSIRGEWNPLDTYLALDCVLDATSRGGDGCSYVALRDHPPGGTHPSAAGLIWWAKWSERGEQGTPGAGGVQIPDPVTGWEVQWVGEFAPDGTLYKAGNIAGFERSSYMCTETHASEEDETPADDTRWELLAGAGGDSAAPGPAPVHKGNWTEREYALADMVRRGGALYYCTHPHTATSDNAPDAGTTEAHDNWAFVVGDGDDAVVGVPVFLPDGAAFVFVAPGAMSITGRTSYKGASAPTITYRVNGTPVPSPSSSPIALARNDALEISVTGAAVPGWVAYTLDYTAA